MIKSLLWIIVFAFVGTIFYSWGMGGASGPRGGVVATVGDIKINQVEYQKTFNSLIDYYRNQFRNQFSQDMIEKLDLKTAALDGLIHRKLMLLQARKNHIRVTDEELIGRIKKIPTFQRDNKFNSRVYQNYLKYQRVSPKEFESNQREALLLEKVEHLIKGQVIVSESEVLEAFKQEEGKVKFDYVVLPEDYFKAPEKITPEEEKEFYEKNKFLFEKPEQIKVQYVKLDNKMFAPEVTPSEEDIRDYYKSQISRFFEEEKFRASHILFSVRPDDFDENAPKEEKQKKVSEEQEKARKKAETVLKKIREGADFAEMAKTHSDDKASGAVGGDLGQFGRGTMVAPFENALSKLKVGGISEPVLTPFGYHIIRLDEKKEARTRPLEEVRDTIIESLKEIKSRQRVRRIIKRISRSASTDNDLARAALEQESEVKVTGFISREEHDVPDIGVVPEFFNAVFSLKDGQVSEPVFTPQASYLLKIKERKPAYIQDIADVRDLLTQAILFEKSKALTAENVKVFAEQVKKNKTLKKVAKSAGLQIKHTPFFSAMDSIPGIGAVQPIKDKVFALDKGETTMAFANKKYYLIQVADKLSAGEPDAAQIKSIYARLHKSKGEIIFNDWINSLRENSKVMIDRTLL